MNTKLKLALVGSILTIGALGTATAFAATSTSTGTTKSTQPTSATKSGPWTGRFEGADGPGHRGPKEFVNMAAITKVLNISESTLRASLESGQSLADVAKSQGVTEDTLIKAIQTDVQSKLDARVASGNMTSAQEKQMLTQFASHAKEIVEHKGGFGPHGGPNGHGKAGNIRMTSIAKAIGIDESTLKTDLQSGQSIVDVAKAHGVTEQSLISTLQADLKSDLDKAVSSGKLTSAKEQQILADLGSHVTKFLEHKGGFPPHGMQGGPMGPDSDNAQSGALTTNE